MADSLSVDIKASLVWLFQDTPGLAVVSDSAKLEYSKSMADGTAVDQADKLWHAERTVAAGANDDLDLNTLTTSLFGSNLTINFVKLKAVLLVNMSLTAGDDLLVGGAAAQAWSAPFGSATDTLRLPADSTIFLVNKKDGWTVTDGSSDTLRINNPTGNAITYRIALVGTSA